jgi:hypothetical protein
MNSHPDGLQLGWIDTRAAKYAVETWHYTRRLPAGKMVRVGVWESGVFIGAIIFSYGANHHIGSPFGLPQTQVVELTRVALSKHKVPVSRILSIALKMLKAQSPGLKLVVSYADSAQQHVGVIYQAANFVYTGKSENERLVIDHKGNLIHKKSFSAKYGHCNPALVNMSYVRSPSKYRYVYLLDKTDDRLKALLKSRSQPYPKNA